MVFEENIWEIFVVKKMNTGLACLCGGLGVIASSMTMTAQALDFNFSFTTNLVNGTPQSPVTTMGVIKNLNEGNNTVFNAIVTSSGTGIPTGLILNSQSQFGGSIFVQNGLIQDVSAVYLQDTNVKQALFFNYISGGQYINQSDNRGGTSYRDESATKYSVASYNFTPAATAVPFDFNPTEGAALGVPLFIGLGILRKRVARKSAASKAVVAVS